MVPTPQNPHNRVKHTKRSIVAYILGYCIASIHGFGAAGLGIFILIAIIKTNTNLLGRVIFILIGLSFLSAGVYFFFTLYREVRTYIHRVRAGESVNGSVDVTDLTYFK